MRAMVLSEPRAVEASPLAPADLARPRPAADEILVAVGAYGVCRTDLHIVEGEVLAPKRPLVPGHQIVGRVVETGAQVRRFRVGDRAGIAWVNRFCGRCEHCIANQENLCLEPTFTGLHRDGGFAELAVAPEAFAHEIPESLGDDAHVAPLLCAGIIGYRALKRTGLRPGHSLALYGFGAAAHVAIQIAKAWGVEVFVMTRSAAARERAAVMGADWVGDVGDRPPHPVDRAVTFAPAGSVIPHALEELKRGGSLAVAGIYLDRVPALEYDRHLFQEKSLQSVTANTRADAGELLALAGRLGIRTDVALFPLQAANEALRSLKDGHLGAQAAVLQVAAAPA